MIPELTIIPVAREGVQLLVLEGEVDVSTAPALQGAIEELSDEMPVVVDLSNLAFIDSSGLHVILGAAPAGVVYTPASNVGRVLRIIQADKAVALYEDAPTAIRAVTGGA